MAEVDFSDFQIFFKNLAENGHFWVPKSKNRHNSLNMALFDFSFHFWVFRFFELFSIFFRNFRFFRPPNPKMNFSKEKWKFQKIGLSPVFSSKTRFWPFRGVQSAPTKKNFEIPKKAPKTAKLALKSWKNRFLGFLAFFAHLTHRKPNFPLFPRFQVFPILWQSFAFTLI